MACALRPDPEHRFDALGTVGSTPTVFVEPETGIGQVTVARLNRSELAIDGDRIQLSPLIAGTNVLSMVVEGTRRGDRLRLMEDCGDGTSQQLCRTRVGGAPGGANPLIGFRIHAQ